MRVQRCNADLGPVNNDSSSSSGIKGCQTRKITTAGKSGKAGKASHLDDGLEVVLRNAVQLERLSRRQPEVSVAVLPGEVVQQSVQLRRAHPRRHLEPQHERVRLIFIYGVTAGMGGSW